MARLPRVELPNIPQHIIQRGNNRQACFASEKDFYTYLNWLEEYSVKAKVDIHAWVLMTNHVHLLCTPRQPKAISQLMQNLGRRYVQYFNYTYKRSGTLWEGRFKSCLVQDTKYLLQLYLYIELNPVRATMVDEPSKYPWSSYQINGLGKQSDLCKPHEQYVALGTSVKERRSEYRNLFKQHIKDSLITDIRESLAKGLALGNNKFKAEIESLSGRRVTQGQRGRPKGWRK
jgi:putative transposase